MAEYTRFRWVVLAVVMFGFINMLFIRSTVPPTIPFLRQQFSMTGVDVGLLMTLTLISYTIMQLPSGSLIDRYGIFTPAFVAAVLTAIVGGMLAFATSVPQFFVLRTLLGFASSCIVVAGYTAVAKFFPPRELGMANAIYTSGALIGGGAFPYAVYPMIAKTYGMSWVFLTPASLTLTYGIIVFFFRGKEPPAPPAEKKMSDSKEPSSYKLLFKNTNLLLLSMINFFNMAAGAGVNTWLLAYFSVILKIEVVTAGFIMTGLSMLALIGTPTMGWIADRLGRKKPVLMVATAATTLSTLTLALIVDSTAAIGSRAIGSLLGGAPYPLAVACIPTLVPRKMVGRAIGINSFFAQLGSAIAPTIAGYILDVTGQYNQGFVVMAVLAAAGIVSAAFVKKV